MIPKHYKRYYELLENKFGRLKRIGKSRTFFRAQDAKILFYFRYSSKRSKALYGLRSVDIDYIKAQKMKSFLLFITFDPRMDMFIPFNRCKRCFIKKENSNDRQYKIIYDFRQTRDVIYFWDSGIELNAGEYRDFNAVLNA